MIGKVTSQVRERRVFRVGRAHHGLLHGVHHLEIVQRFVVLGILAAVVAVKGSAGRKAEGERRGRPHQPPEDTVDVLIVGFSNRRRAHRRPRTICNWRAYFTALKNATGGRKKAALILARKSSTKSEP